MNAKRYNIGWLRIHLITVYVLVIVALLALAANVVGRYYFDLYKHSDQNIEIRGYVFGWPWKYFMWSNVYQTSLPIKPSPSLENNSNTIESKIVLFSDINWQKGRFLIIPAIGNIIAFFVFMVVIALFLEYCINRRDATHLG